MYLTLGIFCHLFTFPPANIFTRRTTRFGKASMKQGNNVKLRRSCMCVFVF